MHSFDIMYTDHATIWGQKRVPPREYPELYVVHHNGDWSGDIKINMEAWHSELLVAGDSHYARHGNPIIEIAIPFDVVARIVAAYVTDRKVRFWETLPVNNWKEVFGLK
jgi:hypothetical protein